MESFTVQTKGFNDIVNITPKIEEIILKKKVKEGVVLVFIPGSTAGITTIEYEKGVIEDLKEFFEKITPIKGTYHHEKAWSDGNGYAHIRAALLKPSLTIPVENGKLLLGTWQQIVLVDFDNKVRERSVIVKVIKI